MNRPVLAFRNLKARPTQKPPEPPERPESIGNKLQLLAILDPLSLRDIERIVDGHLEKWGA